MVPRITNDEEVFFKLLDLICQLAAQSHGAELAILPVTNLPAGGSQGSLSS